MKSLVSQISANSMSHPIGEAARVLGKKASEAHRAKVWKANLILPDLSEEPGRCLPGPHLACQLSISGTSVFRDLREQQSPGWLLSERVGVTREQDQASMCKKRQRVLGARQTRLGYDLAFPKGLHELR